MAENIDSYTYDDASYITAAGADSYTLDDLYRITAENADSYTYDAIGNRLTKNTDDYTYPATSSKLSDVEGDGVSYDAAGNITDDDTREFTINAAGQVEEIEISSVTVGEYVYDANNLRVKKTASSVVTHYVYGMDGLLYGEYDASGDLLREYVYLNGEPIAQIDNVSSSDVLTYLHTDHLGTPRYGTNAAATQVWAWDSDVFGNGAPTGSVTANLRFAGQYYDSESALHYNWNRYYNPATGRYISSDPIGLSGGLNTYLYSMANPAIFIDPEGLIGWDGTAVSLGAGVGSVFLGVGFGGTAIGFRLKSDCVNGKEATIMVAAGGTGLTFGFNLSAMIGQKYKFEDGQKVPSNGLPFDAFEGTGIDWRLFNGVFKVGSLTLHGGNKGSSADWVQLGKVSSVSTGDSTGIGVNVGVVYIPDGRSKVLWGPKYSACSCTNSK